MHYRVKELPTGSYHVVAALLYQTIGARFARDLFLTQGAAVIWFEQAFRAAPFKTVELTRLETTLP